MEKISIMINGTFNDMFGEYYYFLSEVYPELHSLCLNHGIDLEYIDIDYITPKHEETDTRSVLNYLESIDLDRTFYLCFRGQFQGWVPSADDMDELTLTIYPELVDYIGSISITELLTMHALRPFYKVEDGKKIQILPIKHSLFYFRNPKYIDELSDYQKLFYTNDAMGENSEVPDMNIAKAKDLIIDIQEEFDLEGNEEAQIIVRSYEGVWDSTINRYDLISKYAKEYAKIKDISPAHLLDDYGYLYDEKTPGCLRDFTCEGKTLKKVMIEDFRQALMREFPDKF